MKFFIKLTATFLLLIASISALAYFFWYKPKCSIAPQKKSFSFIKKENKNNILVRLKQKANEIILFAKQNNFNSDYCFMVDMKIESGKKRFFVYNLKNDSIELAGLVTHGSSKTQSSQIQFSNQANSLCTSLGKYKIGSAYFGKFGLAFKLYGLDKTNSNAFNRSVVLHAHPFVPNEEVAPLPICQSWGCPMVSPPFLNELKKYIDKSSKPVLIEIYY